MEPQLEFVNARSEAGMDALRSDVENINVSRDGEVPIPAQPDFVTAQAFINNRQLCLRQATAVTQDHQQQSETPIRSAYNRKYSKNNKYTPEQRNKVKELLLAHGNDWKAKRIAEEASVPVSAVYSWKKILKTKHTLDYCANRNGYRKLITPVECHEIARIIDNSDKTITETEIAEELRKAFPNSPGINRLNVSRALRRGDVTDEEGHMYTLKRLTPRGPNANSEENKELRMKVLSELIQYINRGLVWVSVDETHFDLGPYRNYGWAPRGEKAIGRSMPVRTEFSAITGIDNLGNKPMCLIVKGTVDADLFMSFFKKLVNRYKNTQCVFFMDNASVHKKDDLVRICEEAKQTILFNAPYTPELNPIEMFFDEWKNRVRKDFQRLPPLDEFLEELKEQLMAIKDTTIRTLFNHVINVTFQKIMEKKDL